MSNTKERVTRAMSAIIMVAMALTLVVAVTPTPARAALADAGVELVATKVFDGTGHGTSQGSYITSARGFTVADDSPTDGVVSTGDTAQYTLELRYLPGAARTIRVELVDADYLTVISDKTYTRALVRGETRTVTFPVDVEAKDSGATVRTNQRIRANVYVGNTLVDHVDFEPLTVVSAPFADLTFVGGGATATARSQIELRPVKLKPEDSGNYKGVSLGGAWSAKIDVSAAPAGSSWWAATWRATGNWQSTGVEYVPDEDGKITVSAEAGKSGYLLWTGPTDGSTFDINLQVQPGSFTVDAAFPNNGNDTQPGDGNNASQSTANPATGAKAGTYRPNNDWTYIYSIAASPIPPAFPFVTGYYSPRDTTKSMFHPANISGGTPETLSPGRVNVAPGTLGVVRTWVDNDLSSFGYTRGSYDTVFAATLLDPQVQRFNTHTLTGPTVTIAGQQLASSDYTVQWTSTVMTDAQIVNAGDTTNWSTGTPGATAVTVRIIVPRETAEQYRDRDTVLTNIGVSNLTGAELADLGITGNRASRYRTTAGVYVGGSHHQHTTLTQNTTVVQNVSKSATLTTTPTTSYVNRIVDAGTVLDARLFPAGYVNLAGLDESETLRPTVTWTLHPCIASVKVPTDRELQTQSTQSLWDFTVTPAVAGSDGLVCGSTNSTGIVVTGTMRSTWAPTISMDLTASLWLPTMTGFVHPNATASTMTSQVSVNFGADSDRPTLTGNTAPVTIRAKTDNTAATTTTQYVDLGSDPSWRFDIAAIRSGGTEYGTDTVLILPHTGDGTLTAGIANMGVYDGPTESTFATRPALHSARLLGDITNVGAQLYFTTNTNPTFTAADSTWHLVADAGSTAPALADATALRVVVPPVTGRNTVGSVEFTIAQPDDVAVNDTYIVWTGPTLLNGGPANVARPWPAAVTIAQSHLDGYVTWDSDGDGAYTDTDTPIADMPVKIFEGLFPGGVVPADTTPIAEVTTNAFGHYTVPVKSGVYSVQVGRNDATGTHVDRWGNTTGTTIAYSSAERQQHPRDGITLSDTYDAVVGFFATDTFYLGFTPHDVDLTFDVTPIDSNCADVPAGDVCDASWDVLVTNNGTEDLAGTINMNINSPDVQVGADGEITVPTPGKWKALASDSYRTYAIDANNKVWAWGSFRDSSGNNFWNGEPTLYEHLADLEVASLYEASQNSDTTIVFTTDGRVFRFDAYYETRTEYTGPDGAPLNGARGVYSTYATLFIADTDGALWSAALGYTSDRELGRPTTAAGTNEFAPILDADGNPVHAVSMGSASYGSTTFAIDPDGGIWSWGYPGALVRDVVSYPYDDAFTPGKVKGSDGVTFTAVVGLGTSLGLALDTRGHLWTLPFTTTYHYDEETYVSTLIANGITPFVGADGEVVRARDITNPPGSSTDSAYVLDATGVKRTSSDWDGNLTTQPVENSSAFAGATRFVKSRWNLYTTSPTGVWGAVEGYSWISTSGTVLDTGIGFMIGTNPILADHETGTTVHARDFSVGSSTEVGWIDDAGILHYFGLSHMGRGVNESNGTYSVSTVPLHDWRPRTLVAYADEPELATVNPDITRDDTHTYLDVDLPAPIRAGDTLAFRVNAQVASPEELPTEEDQQNLLVQAWWTAAPTPIANILPAGVTAPALPADPGPSLLAAGVLGNPTCSADPAQTVEDQCDQVGTAFATLAAAVVPPPAPPAPPAPVDPAVPQPPAPQPPAATPAPDEPTVTPAPVEVSNPDGPAPPPAPKLSETGAKVAALIIIAALLLLAGTGVLVIRRRMGEPPVE